MALPPFPVPHGLARAGLTLRSRMIGLADRILPAEAALWDFTAGLQRTKLAGALVNSGLADAMADRPRDARTLAGELGLSEDVTLRVLGAAAASRLVRLDRNGKASLARLGTPLARKHPRSIAAWVGYQAAPANATAHAELERQLRGGAEPSGHRLAFGDSVWEYFAEHPEEGARFGEAMRELTAIDLPALSRAYPWPQEGVICDVAGGIGSLLAAILARRSQARGILLDAPEVLADAEGFLQASGVGERVERRAGDLFGALDASADVYVLKWILHDWSDEACRDILRRVRATMPAGSVVVAIDQHLEPGRPSPFSSLADLLMLVECEGGRERSPGQVHALMADAGLRPGRVRHAGLHMVVEGIAA
ncbi:MAG TPA: methyltransferase [Solirubrobacteraceae bacterium]